ncbi:type II secretion system protein [Propionivibrio sp.]|uniref:type II secretion system protein n=1 Tax=Propionivibrio sp. TaxID=2212460 RepID=UPI0039E5733D
MPRSAGFTLIELLVVIAILLTVTLLAFDVLTDDRAQLRYDDTRARLAALERAILGRLGPADPAAVGGFVADNGRLPENVAELLSAGSLKTQAAQTPLFDPQPDTSSCANNGGETTLTDPSALLVKGHRGSYLGGLAFNGRLRDGWGNENGDALLDAANFGWSFDNTSVSQQLLLTSLGADNAAGGDDYAADVASTIRPLDWQVPIGGWTVRVVNRSGADIAASGYLSASLLVFVNNSSGGYWRQFSSNTTAGCLDGTGDGLVNGEPCPPGLDLVFPISQCGLSGIPQGRHLLALVRRTTNAGTSSGDTVHTWTDTTSSPSATRPVVAQITAVAGMALPAARLEIR